MYSTGISIGDCPACGDELYIFKTSTHKRLVKCVADDCPKKTIYGIPKAGKIEVTGIVCPKTEIPMLAIFKNIKLSGGRYKTAKHQVYFFGKSPCFDCSKRPSCIQYKELVEDYRDE